jgi:hypothetical protein
MPALTPRSEEYDSNIDDEEDEPPTGPTGASLHQHPTPTAIPTGKLSKDFKEQFV